MTWRTTGFALLVAATLAAFWTPLRTLIGFSLEHEQYSHLLLIPLVSAWLLFLDRRRIFWQVGTHWGAGVGLLFAGALLHWFGHRHAGGLSENDRLAVAIV